MTEGERNMRATMATEIGEQNRALGYELAINDCLCILTAALGKYYYYETMDVLSGISEELSKIQSLRQQTNYLIPKE